MNSGKENNISIEINQVIRSERKTFRLEVKNGKINVIAPLWAKKDDIDQMIQRHSNWILTKLDHYQKNPIIKKEFLTGETFLFLGEEYPLVVEDNPAYAMRFHNKAFYLAEDCRENAAAYFAQFYKQKAKKIIAPRTIEIAELLKIDIKSVKITSAQSRWGSCTSKGNVNFSFRLVMAPPKTIDSVIVHELAHRFEMNHSSKFYDIVKRIMPDYREHDSWLKKNSPKMQWI
ncbi:MAG: SprT family zinc-dependent metalloprotease [bacterium]